MSNVEEVLSKHVDKQSMDELDENVWPDIVDAMKEYALQVAREGVEEEKAWTMYDECHAVDHVCDSILYRIKSKLNSEDL